MNLEHEFYDLQDLEKRWSEYSLTEKEILKYGVSGKKLQFSILVPNRPNTSVLIRRYAQRSDGEIVTCSETVAGGTGSIYNISTDTVNDIFRAESNYTKNGIPSEVNLNLEIPCPEPKCKFPNLANCYLEYSLISHPGPSDESYTDFTGNRSDLVVTHENVLAFEENHLKPEEQTLPYLDPTHDGYNKQLAEFPQNTDTKTSLEKEKRPGQVELVESQERGKIDEDDVKSNSIDLVFYQRKSDDRWVVGKRNNNYAHKNINGFRMLELLISSKGHNIACSLLAAKGLENPDCKAKNLSNENDRDHYFYGQKNEDKDEKTDSNKNMEMYSDDSLQKAIETGSAIIDELEEKYLQEEDVEKKYLIKEKLSAIKDQLADCRDQQKGRIKEPQSASNIRTSVKKSIDTALKNIHTHTPFMTEYLSVSKSNNSVKTIFTGESCRYEPSKESPKEINWVFKDQN